MAFALTSCPECGEDEGAQEEVVSGGGPGGIPSPLSSNVSHLALSLLLRFDQLGPYVFLPLAYSSRARSIRWEI